MRIFADGSVVGKTQIAFSPNNGTSPSPKRWHHRHHAAHILWTEDCAQRHLSLSACQRRQRVRHYVDAFAASAEVALFLSIRLPASSLIHRAFHRRQRLPREPSLQISRVWITNSRQQMSRSRKSVQVIPYFVSHRITFDQKPFFSFF
jgi:hypothetical protein